MIPIEEIKRRLYTQFAVEDDDLKSLKCQTDEAIRKLYRDMVELSSSKSALTDTELKEKTKEDDYKLTKEEEREFQKNAQVEKKEVVEKKKQAVKIEIVKRKQEFAKADQSHLAKKDQVSFEEAQQALRDLDFGPLGDLDE